MDVSSISSDYFSVFYCLLVSINNSVLFGGFPSEHHRECTDKWSLLGIGYERGTTTLRKFWWFNVKFLQDTREFLWFSFLDFSNGKVLFGPVSDASVLDRCWLQPADVGGAVVSRSLTHAHCCSTLLAYCRVVVSTR